MQNFLSLKNVTLAATAAFGLFAGTASAQFRLDIRLGAPPPPPRQEVVVLDYDRYCVGYRRDLYDADWRLRNAQIEQYNAQLALDDTRKREGEVAVLVEDREILLTDYEKRVAESDAALAAARAAVGKAADDAADARARLHAYEKRIAGAKDDFEAARTLRDAAGIADAQKRIETNQLAAAGAAADLKIAEGRLGELQVAEANAAALNDARVRLVEARERLPRLREDLNIAHEAVFAARQRLDVAIGAVALALHDRDEAMWMLHRDEIMTGRATFESCGFAIDLGVWGGRMPRDPEVVHLYFVHPTTYWVERPVEIHTRVVAFERVTEVTRIRTIQEKHEGAKFQAVAHFERTVPVEQRHASFQRVVAERQELVAERKERELAKAEHRAPRIPESVRAEAKATVIKANADAHAKQIEARADAKAEVTKAKADAQAKQIEARADARAEVSKAKADAKAEKTESQATAKSEVTRARADAQAQNTEAKAQAKAEETKAKADSRSFKTSSRDSRSTSSNTTSRDDRNDPKKKKKDAYSDTSH